VPAGLGSVTAFLQLEKKKARIVIQKKKGALLAADASSCWGIIVIRLKEKEKDSW
jgi:hypothetical protein